MKYAKTLNLVLEKNQLFSASVRTIYVGFQSFHFFHAFHYFNWANQSFLDFLSTLNMELLPFILTMIESLWIELEL